MSIIVSAASRKDGITFYGSKYEVSMNEKKDGTMEYEYGKVEKSVQTADKKMRHIFLLRGLYEFSKNKLIVVVWLISVMDIIAIGALRQLQALGNETFSYIENVSMISIISIILSLLVVLITILFRTMGNFKKVFAYHGAEHKVVHALNNNLELTLENVRAQRRYDRYCGSMLAFFLSLLTAISFLISPYSLFFFPIIFAISWEIFSIKNAENLPALRWLYKLGNIVQEKIITKEPSDVMILASIDAVKLLVELETQQ